MLLGHIPLLQLGQLREDVGLKTHGARLNALTTLDALQLLATCCLLAREYRKTRATLDEWCCDVYHGATHHRTTIQQLNIALGDTRQLEQTTYGSTEARQVIMRGFEVLTRYRHNALDKGLILLHRLIY